MSFPWVNIQRVPFLILTDLHGRPHQVKMEDTETKELAAFLGRKGRYEDDWIHIADGFLRYDQVASVRVSG